VEINGETAGDLGTTGLRFLREGSLAWCIIDRPEARNAFTQAMYFGIKRAVKRVNRDPSLSALIITGSGDVFSSGGDLGRRTNPGDADLTDLEGDILPFLTIRDSRAPVVSAVNGLCQGGGLLVAMVSDIAVASDRAVFRAPELLRGIIDATYATILPAHVGIAVARDILLSARRFDAEEAVRLGVITRMVPHDQLRDAAVKAVREILRTGPIARTNVKRMLNDRYGLVDYMTMRASMDESPEPAEGMRAFMEKRAPNWVPKEFADGD